MCILFSSPAADTLGSEVIVVCWDFRNSDRPSLPSPCLRYLPRYLFFFCGHTLSRRQVDSSGDDCVFYVFVRVIVWAPGLPGYWRGMGPQHGYLWLTYGDSMFWCAVSNPYCILSL